MIVITNVWGPNKETAIMRKSFERQGYEVAAINAKGNGKVLKELLACYKRASTGHELFIYSDGADTFCQRKFTRKELAYISDKIVYSAEKNCWPKSELEKEYPEGKTIWRFLNGGNYAGPLALIIEFFEKYGLDKHPATANGQWEQHNAYLQAIKDGFPIELDEECKLFQTTAFDPMNEGHEKESAFEFTRAGNVRNTFTKTVPAILHANGRSPMEWYWNKHDWIKDV